MTQNLEIYKCELCGNIVEVINPHEGELVCCGLPMELAVEHKVDQGEEKHVPIIEKLEDGYMVTVSTILHPMEEKHHIEWIELIGDNKVYRQFLKPGDEPIAIFKIDAKKVSAREYCNLHGLWKS